MVVLPSPTVFQTYLIGKQGRCGCCGRALPAVTHVAKCILGKLSVITDGGMCMHFIIFCKLDKDKEISQPSICRSEALILLRPTPRQSEN